MECPVSAGAARLPRLKGRQKAIESYPRSLRSGRSLVEREISIASTFLAAAKLACSRDHRTQALRNAIAAFDTADRFAQRVPANQVDPTWNERLLKLQFALERLLSTRQASN